MLLQPLRWGRGGADHKCRQSTLTGGGGLDMIQVFWILVFQRDGRGRSRSSWWVRLDYLRLVFVAGGGGCLLSFYYEVSDSLFLLGFGWKEVEWGPLGGRKRGG